MPRENRRRSSEPNLRPLHKRDIDERLEQLVLELMMPDGSSTSGGPRIIHASELVRRMRPFLVYN